MYYPTLIRAKNFQSFADLEYKFNNGTTLIINGENFTDEGQENNGSGKSTLQEIIYYCLLGSSSTGKRDCKLIRWGENSSTIELRLYNSITKTTFVIKRTLYLKKSSSLQLIEIDEQGREASLSNRFSSVNEGNKLILEMIDIDSDDLKNFFLINGEKFVSFFSSSDTKKRDLIGRFSSADRLLSINNVFDNKNQELISKKKSLEIKTTVISSKIEVYRQELNSIESESSEDFIRAQIEEKQVKIEELKIKIKGLQDSQKLIDKSIFDYNQSLDADRFLYNVYDKGRRSLRKISYDKYLQEAQQNIIKYLDSGDSIRLDKEKRVQELYEYKEILNNLQLNLKSSITCPKCHYEFVLNKQDVDIQEVKQLIGPTKDLIQDLEKDINIYDDKIKTLTSQTNPQYQALLQNKNKWLQQEEKKIRKISNVSNCLSTTARQIEWTETELEKFVKQKRYCELDIDKCEAAIKQFSAEIESFKENNIPIESKRRIESITNNLEQLISEQESLQEELNVIENEIRDLNKWEQHFKQFYTYLTNKSLKTIEDLCNNFLDKIKTDLQIKFEGFKVLTNGSIKEDITARILRDGIEEEDYRCFSGGEKGRLIFSTILAFQHLINLKSKSGGLDLLFVDEILDKVDSLGMYNFTKSLEMTKKTILLTSQVRIKEDNSNTLTVIKENGISRIK